MKEKTGQLFLARHRLLVGGDRAQHLLGSIGQSDTGLPFDSGNLQCSHAHTDLFLADPEETAHPQYYSLDLVSRTDDQVADSANCFSVLGDDFRSDKVLAGEVLIRGLALEESVG